MRSKVNLFDAPILLQEEAYVEHMGCEGITKPSDHMFVITFFAPIGTMPVAKIIRD